MAATRLISPDSWPQLCAALTLERKEEPVTLSRISGQIRLPILEEAGLKALRIRPSATTGEASFVAVAHGDHAGEQRQIVVHQPRRMELGRRVLLVEGRDGTVIEVRFESPGTDGAVFQQFVS